MRLVSTKNSGWIADGLPHTDQLHLTVEKFTRVDLNTLKYEVTIDDPGAYTAPSSGFNLRWTDGLELFEYVCQEENYAPTLMVGQGTKVDRGSLIVP